MDPVTSALELLAGQLIPSKTEAETGASSSHLYKTFLLVAPVFAAVFSRIVKTLLFLNHRKSIRRH